MRFRSDLGAFIRFPKLSLVSRAKQPNSFCRKLKKRRTFNAKFCSGEANSDLAVKKVTEVWPADKYLRRKLRQPHMNKGKKNEQSRREGFEMPQEGFTSYKNFKSNEQK